MTKLFLRGGPFAGISFGAKTAAKCSGSKRFAATGFEIGVGFFSERIELAGFDVRFEFTVPSLGNELLEPSGEPGQFIRGQLSHYLFKFLHAHKIKIMVTADVASLR